MRKVLLALDASPSSRRAAEYAATVLARMPESEVFLLSVLERVSAEEVAPPQEGGEVHGDEDHLLERRRGAEFLAEVERLLQREGVAADRIRSELKPLGRGVVHQILEEAEARGCDTIVVGRRGLSRVEALVAGSVSSTLVRQAAGRAVWVVA